MARYRLVVALLVLALVVTPFGFAAHAQTPSGEVVIAWHVTIAPTWFDPSTAPPQITPFGILYGLHDSVVRPLPGGKIGPSLAEAWSESADGLTYEFRLRRGLKFHNGDPLTTEDVKFSLDRYKGAGSKEIHGRIRQTEIVDPQVFRIHLKSRGPTSSRSTGPPPPRPASSSRRST
jgi:peptide/nickel transport system substrate-binding protein